MRTLSGCLFVVLLLFVQTVSAGGRDPLEDYAWNAGAVLITNEDGSYGQGYLVEIANDIYIFTIKHVLDFGEQDSFFVTIPGIVERGKLSMSRVSCIDVQSDNACFIELSSQLELAILERQFPIAPYQRLYESEYLVEGQLVGSPRPDTGKWTVYIIAEIQEEAILLNAVFVEHPSQPGTYIAIGNFCHGRSGAPVVPITISNGRIHPIREPESNSPISFGELQAGLGDEHPDYVDASNTCSYSVVAARPD